MAGLVVILVVLPVGFVFYVGVVGPDTKAVPGRQVPARYLERISQLRLLDRGEKIRYFYSDAFLDIENGMYFFTDRKVVLYCTDWQDPRIIVPFSKVVNIEAEFNDSFMEDSLIILTLDDQSAVTFPVSSEAGGDRRLFKALKAAWMSGGGRPATEADDGD